jgi:ATP-dependent DNA helicase RecQ
LRKTLQTGEIRLLHVFKEDIFCNEIGKTVSSIVDGPVLEEYLIERM